MSRATARAVIEWAVLIVASVTLTGCSTTYGSSGSSDGASPPQNGQEVNTTEESTVPVQEAPAESTPTDDPFGIGAPFMQECSIAWPSAPVITSSAIQLTLQCSGVPANQFQLIVAVYPDPTLPVTPSTGTMLVSGSVADTGRSDAGIDYLVVQASTVEF